MPARVRATAHPPNEARRPAYGGGPAGRTVTEQRGELFTHIEQTQAALRESIAVATQLTEQSDFLLQKHKRKSEQNALDAHARKAE